MGSFSREPIMPPETHAGYVEGYLDALKKVQEHIQFHPNMSLEDIFSVMRTSLKTTVTMGGYTSIPDDLSAFPETKKLLNEKALRVEKLTDERIAEEFNEE